MTFNKAGIILKTRKTAVGYKLALTTWENIRADFRVQDIVAEVFLKKTINHFVFHKDGNIYNNKVDNIEIKTIFQLYGFTNRNSVIVVDFPNYIVRKNGLVVNRATGNLVKPVYAIANRSMAVRLWKDNRTKMVNLYRLLAIHFIPNPENKPDVHHIDYDRMNHNLNNLKWFTKSENMKDAFNEGVVKNEYKKGFEHKHCKMTPQKLDYIFDLRGKGKKLSEISNQTGFCITYLSQVLKGAVYGKVFSK